MTWDGHAQSFCLSGRVRREEGWIRRAAQLQELPEPSRALLSLSHHSPHTDPSCVPPTMSAMLPGKAEKRIASSVFITLVPPRREAAAKERTQREQQLDGAEVPSTHHPHTSPAKPPELPNGGEGGPCERCWEDGDGAEDAVEEFC